MSLEKALIQCDNCKKHGPGRFLEPGWWTYPKGWLTSLYAEVPHIVVKVCSSACARTIDAKHKAGTLKDHDFPNG